MPWGSIEGVCSREKDDSCHHGSQFNSKGSCHSKGQDIWANVFCHGQATLECLHYAKSYMPFELFVNENYKL